MAKITLILIPLSTLLMSFSSSTSVEVTKVSVIGETEHSLVFWSIAIISFLLLSSIAWSWTLRRQLKIQTKAIQESEELFGIIFKETPSIVIISEFETGKLIKVNKAFERSTGYTASEVIGVPLEKTGLFNSVDDKDLRKKFLSKKKKITDQECNFSDKSGQIRTGLFSGTRILYKNIPATILVITDITKRKKLETEIIIAKEQAIKSDKLKSAFLANMSHEIRTPMNVIVGFAELLTDPNLSKAERNEYVEHVKNNSYNLLDIINDIINISKIESGTISVSHREIEVNKLVEKLCSNYHFQARQKNLNFECNLTKDTITLYSDEVKLHQILSNILSNAVKFTTNGTIRFGYNIDKDFIEFRVEDTGCGFPQEQINDVFARFVQLSNNSTNNRTGTGLGLPIAKAYTELLGGSISATSQIENGSCFIVRIPIRLKEKEL